MAPLRMRRSLTPGSPRRSTPRAHQSPREIRDVASHGLRRRRTHRPSIKRTDQRFLEIVPRGQRALDAQAHVTIVDTTKVGALLLLVVHRRLGSDRRPDKLREFLLRIA